MTPIKRQISGTKEWAVAEINCSIGCPYNCRYCYARLAALKNGSIASVDEWTQSRIIDSAIDAVHPVYPGQVMFPTAHDISEDNLDAAMQVVGNLLDTGNHVLIVSKPSVSCIERMCDRFYQFRDHILFRFTITARDDTILNFWEPGAPGYRERLDSLEIAFTKGFATSISVEPMLDADDIEGLVAELSKFVTHSIWIGKMNKIDERVTVDNEQMAGEVTRIKAEQTEYGIKALYDSLKDHPLIRWKESIKQVVGLELLTESGLDR